MHCTSTFLGSALKAAMQGFCSKDLVSAERARFLSYDSAACRSPFARGPKPVCAYMR